MVEYMNSKFKCIVCGKRPKRKDSNILVNGKPVKLTVPLQKHHVKYFPEVIAYVHDECHREINEGKHQHLVQYSEGESREFYSKKSTKLYTNYN